MDEQILPSSTTQSYGYVLPYVIYEQQTAAASARNLWGLQFWANTVGVKVVESFRMNLQLSYAFDHESVPNPWPMSTFTYDVD